MEKIAVPHSLTHSHTASHCESLLSFCYYMMLSVPEKTRSRIHIIERKKKSFLSHAMPNIFD